MYGAYVRIDCKDLCLLKPCMDTDIHKLGQKSWRGHEHMGHRLWT